MVRVLRRNRPHFTNSQAKHAAGARELACMQVNMHDGPRNKLYGYKVLLCVVSLPAKGAGPKLGSVGAGSGFPNRLAVASGRLRSPSHGSLLPFLSPEPCDTKPSTAPSVTPESRRGHPNRLAEPLAVAPWALLARSAHARRGLQLLAESLCGPRMGLLMSLALHLRWHWMHKSGPHEAPPRDPPRLCPASDSPDFASDNQGTTKPSIYCPDSSDRCAAGEGE